MNRSPYLSVIMLATIIGTAAAQDESTSPCDSRATHHSSHVTPPQRLATKAADPARRLVHEVAVIRSTEADHLCCGGLTTRPSPDVPWFTLPRNKPTLGAYSPLVLPVAGPAPGVGGPPNPPYSSPGTSLFQADNENIRRFWSNPPTYVVTIPRSVPPQPGPGNIPNVNSPIVFPGVPIPPGYTWKSWIGDVQATFAKFSTVLTTSASAVYGGFGYELSGYDVASGNAIPAHTTANGGYVWASAWTGGSVGPTGNGINEIILTDQPGIGGGLGLTSMLVDPDDGQIIECDCLFYAGGPAGPGLIQAVGGTITTPREWTALTHEIGHFFGLDHTNLHTGIPHLPAANPIPFASFFPLQGVPGLAGFVSAPTIAEYPPTHANPAIPAFPAMAGFITHLGLGVNYTTTPLHQDDATGLSKLYPVTMPVQGSAKRPLINVSARIIGQHRLTATGAGVFGTNVYVVPENQAGTTFPVSGTISGISKNDDDPRFLDVSIYGQSGTATYTASVMGATFAGGLTASGDISIDGIAPGTLAAPLAYDVVFENPSSLGVNAGNQAEWFNDGAFYTGNPLSTWPTFTLGSGSNINSVVLRHFLATSGLTSMRTVAGTVIALDPTDNQEAFFPSAVLDPNGSSSGTNFGILNELGVRPLVDIQPRDGRFSTATGGQLIITAVPTAPTGAIIDSTKRLFVNGVDQTGLLPVATQTGGQWVWSIPLTGTGSIVGSIPNSTPVRVSFFVTEQNGNVPGRNDVIL